MTKSKTARPSFSLRLQPYDGSLLAEVVQYLNSLDRAEANRRVENVLVMALLTQARLYDDTRSQEERRRCCIEACDALEKHASALRQLVGVELLPTMVPFTQPSHAISDVGQDNAAVSSRPSRVDVDETKDAEDEPSLPPPKARLKAKATASDVDALFGG